MMKKLCAFTIDTYTKRMFVRGLRDGFPIGLGYLAVSFALGIAARRAGLDVLAAAVMSLTNLTSAGQAAGITLIAAGTTVAEMALTQLVINLRYLLMSCALSQKVAPQTPWYHRMLVSFGITDELFALQTARRGHFVSHMRMVPCLWPFPAGHWVPCWAYVPGIYYPPCSPTHWASVYMVCLSQQWSLPPKKTAM